jgi:hypothetical protein
MIRKLWWAFCLLALVWIPPLEAATVTGSVTDLTGKPLTTSTFVRFELKGCATGQPRVVGQTTFASLVKDVIPNGAGRLTGTIFGNDVIECSTVGNTYYHVSAWNGTALLYSNDYVIQGNVFDINSAIPLSVPGQNTSAPVAGDLNIAVDGGKTTVVHGNAATTRMFFGMSGDGTKPSTWGYFPLTANDLPGNIPASKIIGLPTDLSGIANLGTAASKPIEFFDLAGAASSVQTTLTQALGNKADTSALAAKADTTALTSGLATKADATAVASKANTTDVTTALALKADTTALTSGLAAKADTTTVTSGLAAKADTTALTSGLATKADTTTLTSGLAAKVDQSAMTTALATKADQSTVTTALAAKADQSTVTTALAAKADTTALTSGLAAKADSSSVATSLATKADATALTSGLAAKADQSAMTTALAAKADQSTVTTALAAKADTTSVTTSLATKADVSAVTAASVFDPGLTNSVTRTLTLKSRDVVSVKDFGAVGNGTTDDTISIQNALDWAYSNSKCLSVPGGTYKLTNSKGFPTSALDYRGECLKGESKLTSILRGPPGLDILGHLDPSNAGYKGYLQDTVLQDLQFQIDTSLDVSKPLWQASTAYTPVSGAVTLASTDGGIWTVTTASAITSGTTPLAGTGPTMSDGTVTWTYVSTTADTFYNRTTVNSTTNSPYYFPVGNCGLAIPRYASNLGGGMNHAVVQRNLFISYNGANQSNHTCSIYVQGPFNASAIDYNRFRYTYYGFVQAPAMTQRTSAEFAPDGDNFNQNEYYNLFSHITYDDNHTTMNHPQMYASTLNAGTIYALKFQSAIRSAPGAIQIIDPYFETNAASTNIQSQWEGTNHMLTGGSVKQDNGSTAQIVWNASNSYINGTGIGNSTAAGTVLTVNGSFNTFDIGLQNAPASNLVANNGTNNNILTHKGSAKGVSFSDSIDTANNKPSNDTFTLGLTNNPIGSMNDLVLTGADYGASGTILGTAVNDSTSNLFNGRVYKVNAPASFFNSIWKPGLLTVGSRIPKGLYTFYVYGKCTAACTQPWYVRTNTDSVIRASGTFSFGTTYTMQSMTVDLTGATAGDTLQIQANATSPSTDFYLSAIAFRPINMPSVPKYSITKYANGSGSCVTTGGCWGINGSTTLIPVTASSTTQSISLFPVSASNLITFVSIKPRVACAGVTGLTVGVGNSTNSALFASPYALTNTVSSSNFQDSAVTKRAATGADTIVASFTSSGGNLDAVTAGCSFDIWVDQSILQ